MERCPWIVGTCVATIYVIALQVDVQYLLHEFIFHISSLLCYAALIQHMVHNSLKRHIAILC